MSDVCSKVKTWIEQSGHSLEMVVASTFRRTGYGAVQGDFYADPQTSELRETDVVAHLVGDVGDDDYMNLMVVSECKAAPAHPWVLFAAPTDFPGYHTVSRCPGTEAAKRHLIALRKNRAVRELRLFRMPKNVGYSLTTAAVGGGKSPKDTAYEAVWEVTKATAGLLAREDPLEATLGWPLVVLRGQLFEATLDANCDVEVTPITEGVLAWRNPVIQAQTPSIVTIVTEPALDGLLTDLKSSWDSLCTALTDIHK
jgi:hypothetical protein